MKIDKSDQTSNTNRGTVTFITALQIQVSGVISIDLEKYLNFTGQ